jgi:hypothetical protein
MPVWIYLRILHLTAAVALFVMVSNVPNLDIAFTFS